VAVAGGARVYGSPLSTCRVYPPLHPLSAGARRPAAAGIRAALERYERVLLIGGRAFMVYPYTDGSPLPEGTELLHLSPDPGQLGRTYAVRLGIQGDPLATLSALVPVLRERADKGAAEDAVAAGRTRRQGEVDQLEETARSRYAKTPVDPMAAAHALVRAMPAGSAVVDEAVTTGAYVRGFHHWTETGRYFFCKGGGLGWGMPAALGVSLAHDRSLPVLCVVGDGSAMYSCQALWTAAHEQLPVVFAVVNNRQYLILKNNLRNMKGDTVRLNRYVAMDIVDPPVDYVGLAASLGVASTRVDHADDIGDAVQQAAASGAPHLIEIPISAPS
jgi:benzoylformate decarboxylase